MKDIKKEFMNVDLNFKNINEIEKEVIELFEVIKKSGEENIALKIHFYTKEEIKPWDMID